MSAQIIEWPAPSGSEGRKAEAARERANELDAMHIIDRAAEVLDRLEERAAQIAQRIAELQASKKLAEQRMARLEEQVLAALSRRGLSHAHGFRRLLESKTNPPKLLVLNAALIPRQYIRTKTLEEPMKDAIKAALASGEEIGGVRLVQGVSLVRKGA